MSLTLEMVKVRLEQLRVGYQEKQAEFEQMRLDLAAQEGAMQECEWTVQQLSVTEVVKSVTRK